MRGYSEAVKSWWRATPTVRMSANTSKPSKVQPRFDARSAFHCARVSERYHGTDGMADSVMIASAGSGTDLRSEVRIRDAASACDLRKRSPRHETAAHNAL